MSAHQSRADSRVKHLLVADWTSLSDARSLDWLQGSVWGCCSRNRMFGILELNVETIPLGMTRVQGRCPWCSLSKAKTQICVKLSVYMNIRPEIVSHRSKYPVKHSSNSSNTPTQICMFFIFVISVFRWSRLSHVVYGIFLVGPCLRRYNIHKNVAFFCQHLFFFESPAPIYLRQPQGKSCQHQLCAGSVLPVDPRNASAKINQTQTRRNIKFKDEPSYGNPTLANASL